MSRISLLSALTWCSFTKEICKLSQTKTPYYNDMAAEFGVNQNKRTTMYMLGVFPAVFLRGESSGSLE